MSAYVHSTDKELFGDFEVYLDQLLGKGGMGMVFRGRQISLHRPCAIKVMKREFADDQHLVDRFKREGVLLGRLADPHIVQIYGGGQEGDKWWYAMELLEGETLTDAVPQNTALAEDALLEVGWGVARALDAAWMHQVVHRDIKPDNIFRTNDGRIKVMDYGLAKTEDTSITLTNEIMGTIAYMSPEHIRGEDCDIRSDIYALGIVLYEYAAGRHPFESPSPGTMLQKHMYEVPRPPQDLNPEISNALNVLILRCIAKSPGDRYQEPGHLLADLASLRGSGRVGEDTVLAVEQSMTRTVTTGSEPETRRRQPSALRAVLLGVLMVALMWLIQPLLEEEPDLFELNARRGIQALVEEDWTRAANLLESALRWSNETHDAARIHAVKNDLEIAKFNRFLDIARRAEESGSLELALTAYKRTLEFRPDMEVELKIVELAQQVHPEEDVRTERLDDMADRLEFALNRRDWKRALMVAKSMHNLVPESADAAYTVEVLTAVDEALLSARRGDLPNAIERLSPYHEEPVVNEVLAQIHSRRRR
jgi:predicted Ser/Thr protein kinase/tetratricopeptide (TPR) repeat protein